TPVDRPYVVWPPSPHGSCCTFPKQIGTYGPNRGSVTPRFSVVSGLGTTNRNSQGLGRPMMPQAASAPAEVLISPNVRFLNGPARRSPSVGRPIQPQRRVAVVAGIEEPARQLNSGDDFRPVFDIVFARARAGCYGPRHGAL